MNISRRQILLLLALALLLILTNFAIEILAPDAQTWLKENFGDRYKATLIGLLIVGTIITLLISDWQNWFKKDAPAVTTALEPSLRDELIANLKAKYQKRIDSKLAGRFPVNLRINTSRTGTSEETAQNFITLQDEEVGHEIGEIFDRAKGRLLVVGLPGAGKTTLLLQLAVELLDRAECVAHIKGVPHVAPAIPVLLNLATWRTEFVTFDEWLKRILPNDLGASKALAEKIRANMPLILLLDGLDEVPDVDRNSCLEAIGQYGMKPESQFVISSRINEYAATKDAPVYSQVEVVPLTADQIEKNLIAYAGLTPEAKPLLNAIQKDPLLNQAIENPFYLNTAQLLFASGKNWSEFRFVATDVEGRQQELVERFVNYALTQKVKREYHKVEAKKWLGFLAGKMEEGKLRVFEFVNLQPWWIKSRRVSIWLLVLPVVLLRILRTGTIYLGAGWLAGRIDIGLYVWLFFGIPNLFNTFKGMYKSMIFKIDFFQHQGLFEGKDIKWKWPKLLELKISLMLIFKSNLLIGLTFILVVIWLFFGYYTLLATIKFLIIYIGGLSFYSLVILGLFEFRLLKLKNPYQRFGLLLWGLQIESVFSNIITRVFLFFESSLPLRLVHFLNEMSRRHLLEFDGDLDTETGGGSWRWRHRIIQEWFLRKDE
ncbi:MAG: hypothetical protein KA138_07165 [Saprospiraceae bacterium]|nr:hypothetical protein [Saprospiraceae bacterium]